MGGVATMGNGGSGATGMGGAGAGPTCTPGSQARFPVVVSSDASQGGLNWINASNAAQDNGNAATSSLGVGQKTAQLDATSFQFQIPANVVIDAITVRVERSRGAGANAVRDLRIQVLKNLVTGDNVPDTVTNWPTSKLYKTYNGTTNPRWNLTWTPADLNGAKLRVRVRAEHAGSMDTAVPRVHRIEATVTWSCPP
jgi:hypothetical protein